MVVFTNNKNETKDKNLKFYSCIKTIYSKFHNKKIQKNRIIEYVY